MHLVASSSGFWAPRSTEETRDHFGQSPRENHLLFPLNESTDRNGKAPITRISWSSSGLHAFRFPPSPSLFFFLFSFTFYRRALARIRRAQRWFSWPTGIDWRCELHSSRPRATSQWPTEDLDRARPSPLSPSPPEHDVRPKQARCRRHCSHHCTRSFLLFFFRSRSSLSLSLSSKSGRAPQRHRWKTRAGQDICVTYLDWSFH